MTNKTIQMATTLPEFQYLQQLIRSRLNQYFPATAGARDTTCATATAGSATGATATTGSATDSTIPSPPPLADWQLPMAKFIADNRLNAAEATLLLIGLAPHFQPDGFDQAIESKIPGSGNFPKLGGVRGKNSRSFLPTGETALFLLGGEDRQQRQDTQALFGVEHLFGQKKILWLEEVPYGEPLMSGKIIISQDYIDTFLIGRPAPPHFNSSFPARLIREKRNWSSLVINEELQSQINEIINWLKYNDHLLNIWGMGDRLKKGYRALFYGPPGTGKTLTAALLGNEMRKDVYRVDLSMVVSKYIGETEKNLELLFARAEDKGWILFFDEADALFGKRTSVRDANDKYANQEVSYLLQRIEDFNGLIILATNMKNNIDEAFVRRFNAILRFPFPEAAERKLIWEKSFPAAATFAATTPAGASGPAPATAITSPARSSGTGAAAKSPIDIPDAVKKYELAGGSIINVVHYASLKAVERSGLAPTNGATAAPGANDTGAPLTIYLSDVHKGIQIELNKHGKPFNP
jgi:ATPase family protein associated with various cellular activities (AAA)